MTKKSQAKTEENSNIPEEKKKTIWDALNNILLHKKEEERETDLQVFSPFIINRALGKYPDCLFYANEMNLVGSSSEPLWVYDFYFYGLPPRKRFAKWFKSAKNEDLINTIKSYFSVSRKVAEGYLQLFSEEQKKEFLLLKGGVR